MQAKALTAYPINAFTGRELVRYEWRLVPAGYEAEAQRLEAAGLVELQDVAERPVKETTSKGDEYRSYDFADAPTLSVDLESLTIVQLKDMAREKGVTGFSTMKKAELVDALRDD